MENSSHENVLVLAQTSKQSANHSLCKLHALGNGAYGKVYKIVDRQTGKAYAFKRNLSNTSFGFSEVMREGNMMIDLNGHPLIVSIVSVSYGDPFNNDLGDPLSPIQNASNNQVKLVRDDSIHFILEFGVDNLDRFAGSKTFTQSSRQMKQIVLDLLLAVEFINKSGIMHRDLKPDNVIVFGPENTSSCTPYGSGQIPSFPEDYSFCHRVKISDFGMAKNLVINEINTPRVTTSWYRAPEVLNSANNYDYAIDAWALGCIIYRLLVGRALLYNTIDGTEQIRENLIRHTLHPLTQEDLDLIGYKGHVRAPVRIESFWERVRKYNYNVYAVFSKSQNQYLKPLIEDLVLGLLTFNPAKRMTVSEALESPFFESHREYIEGMRKAYPPKKPLLYFHSTPDIIERKWANGFLEYFYTYRQNYPWYKDSWFFLTISLYDRVLRFFLRKIPSNKIEDPSRNQGRIFNKTEAELYLYSCMYICIKYMHVLWSKLDLLTILPLDLIDRTSDIENKLHRIEMSICSNFDLKIHRLTVYDYLSHYPEKERRAYLDRAFSILTSPPYRANEMNPMQLASAIVNNNI